MKRSLKLFNKIGKKPRRRQDIKDYEEEYEDDSEEYVELDEQYENLDDASDSIFDAISSLEEITLGGDDGGVKITIHLG